MALDKAIKEALKDVNKDIVKKITELSDTAEATNKIKEANKDLTDQRNDWEKDKKDFKSQISEFETDKTKFEKTIKEKDLKITTLEKEKLSPEDLALLKNAEDVKAQMNALVETVNTVKTELAESKKIAIEKDKKVLETSKKAAQQAQKSALSKELTKHKVLDSDKGNNNSIAINHLLNSGSCIIDVDDSGNHVEKYYTINENGDKATSTIKDMVKSFVESNQTLISPSGNVGSGTNHHNSSGNTNNEYSYRDTKKANDALWDKSVKTT